MKKWTIHDIPLILQPLYLIGSYLIAFLIMLRLKVFAWACTLTYLGEEHIQDQPNYILSVWHEDLTAFFISHQRFEQPHIWMSYPLWYMKPVHIMKKWIGIKKLALGASGIDGKKALHEVMDGLREGYSTFIAPDGPKGPLNVLKDGVLQMSLQTNTPVIALSFALEKQKRSATWDRKRYPRLFSKMTIRYSKPVFVTEENYEESRKLISEEMSSGGW